MCNCASEAIEYMVLPTVADLTCQNTSCCQTSAVHLADISDLTRQWYVDGATPGHDDEATAQELEVLVAYEAFINTAAHKLASLVCMRRYAGSVVLHVRLCTEAGCNCISACTDTCARPSIRVTELDRLVAARRIDTAAIGADSVSINGAEAAGGNDGTNGWLLTSHTGGWVLSGPDADAGGDIDLVITLKAPPPEWTAAVKSYACALGDGSNHTNDCKDADEKLAELQRRAMLADLGYVDDVLADNLPRECTTGGLGLGWVSHTSMIRWAAS